MLAANKLPIYLLRALPLSDPIRYQRWLAALLVFCFSGGVAASLLDAQMAQPADKDRPTLDEILSDNNSPVEHPTLRIRNLFFQVDSLAIKICIFLGLAFIIYCMIVIGFDNALERGAPPLPVFFRLNAILTFSILVLAFLCFSEYTYRDEDAMVIGLGDHLKQVNWLFWGLITALVIALLIVSKRGGSDGESQET